MDVKVQRDYQIELIFELLHFNNQSDMECLPKVNYHQWGKKSLLTITTNSIIQKIGFRLIPLLLKKKKIKEPKCALSTMTEFI